MFIRYLVVINVLRLTNEFIEKYIVLYRRNVRLLFEPLNANNYKITNVNKIIKSFFMWRMNKIAMTVTEKIIKITMQIFILNENKIFKKRFNIWFFSF